MPTATLLASSAKASSAPGSLAGTTLPDISATAGKLLVLVGRMAAGGSLQTVNSVTDDSSNTWEVALSNIYATNNRFVAYICRSPASNAALTVTVNYATDLGENSSDEYFLLQYDISGVGSSPVDVAAVTTAGGGSTSMTSDAFTTAQADELCVVTMFGLTTFSAGSGYTLRAGQNYSGVQDQLFDAVQTSQTASMNCGGSAGPIAVVTIKTASSGGSSGAVKRKLLLGVG